MEHCPWSELFLSIAPSRFNYLKSILEGYDHLVILSSVNGKNGVVCLRYPLDSEAPLFFLLTQLAPDIRKDWH